MWKFIYNKIFQLFTMSWTDYLQKSGECGINVQEKFETYIYQTSGFVLFGFTISFCVLFYYYFNLKFGNYYKLKTFLIFMLLNSSIIGIFTYIIVRSNLSKFSCIFSGQYLSFSFINFLYGMILFFIISIVIKKWSPMGYKTPF
jgi:hypothetical protein